MSFSINKTIIGGNITKDLELKQSQSGLSVLSFSIACARKFKREGEPETDFFDVTCFGKTAEAVARFCKKGSPLIVTGQVNTSEYTRQDGLKVKTVKIVADDVTFLPRASSDAVNSAQGSQNERPASPYIPSDYSPRKEPEFEAVEDDGLPF